MTTETIPLSRLEANLRAILHDCADSGQPMVVELPDSRLLTIQPVVSVDDLTDRLLESNEAFRNLVTRSTASPRKLFVPLPAEPDSAPEA